MKRIICLLLVLVGGLGVARAQTFSVEPDTFAVELKEWLETSRRPYAQQVGGAFYSAWTSGAFAGREDSIRAVAERYRAKGFRPYDQAGKLIDVLTVAANHPMVKSPQFDSLLYMLDQTAVYYEPEQLRNALNTVKLYLDSSSLYHINFNRLHAYEGELSFRFVAPAPAFDDYFGFEQTTEEVTEEDDDYWGGWDEEEEEETEDDWSDDWDTWDTGSSSFEVLVEEPEDENSALIEELTSYAGPEPEGPIMHFDYVTLVMATPWDSVAIMETNGDLTLTNGLFIGQGGRFDWTAAGLPADQVWVELENYNFNISVPELSADNVTLNYEGYIKDPVKGVFDFQSRRHAVPEQARYPRFMSYGTDVEITSLGDDIISYTGGFSLNGQQINSNSVFAGFALLTGRDSTGLLFRAKSKRYVFEGDEITTDRAVVALYQGQDSIYHPALRLRYTLPTRQLVLQTTDGGFKHFPYRASYYEMDFFTDIIRWDLNTDTLDISILNARDQVPAVFESEDYFNEEQFNNLTRVFGFHPLLILTNFASKKRSNSFFVDELSQATNLSEGKIDGAMKYLRERSFVEYDPVSKEITIQDKTWHYVRSKFRKKDYDNMFIPSYSPGRPNATVNRRTKELTLRGIPKFYISEELETFIVPNDETITLLGNRDFKFNGELQVGNFQFIGEDFTFNYDAFLVNLTKIDSIRFYIEVKDENGNPQRKLIDNQLVGINNDSTMPSNLSMNAQATAGTIYINRPDNKSGIQRVADFPVFDANQGAIVYFNDPSVLGGVYDKSLYYVIPPFKIDSLADSDPGAISFPGTFYSNGILPPIEEKLVITEDNILGFRHQLPPEGLSLYEGKGRVYNEIVMDRNGLQGQGTIDYLSAHMESNRYTFYEDSVITKIGSTATIAPGQLGAASYPQGEVTDYSMTWYPKRDQLFLTNNADPFSLYNGTATLNGRLEINPEMASGRGKLLTRGSETRSQRYSFAEDAFIGRNAYFEIKSNNPRKPAVLGQDVRVDFQLARNTAEISPEREGEAGIGFPYAQYKTSIPSAIWSLTDNRVTMTKPADVPIENSYFYSTRREQDSLVFNATTAEYIIDSLLMRIGGIPYIVVADAYIIPNNNEVVVRQNAEIQKLAQARLVIDTLNEYHNMFDGTIDIVSRKKFFGDATYELVNAVADTFAIKLDRFQLVEVENPRRGQMPANTVSSGTVAEADNVVISPGMLYRGRITMYADKPALELRGFVKLDFKTVPDYDTWIVYQSSAESQEVVFDFASSTQEGGRPLEAGLHFNSVTGDIYHTFVTRKENSRDHDFFVPSGNLYYDELTTDYVIADPLKDTSDAWAGKVFRFDENQREIYFEGAVQFMEDEPLVGLQSAAKGEVNLDSSLVRMNTFLTLNFDIPKTVQQEMGLDLLEVIELLGAPQGARDPLATTYLMAEIVGEENARYYDEASLQAYTPMLEASRKLETTLAICDVDMEWSSEQRAWYSKGSRIGLSNVQDIDLNASLEGYLEIRRTITGQELHLFIKASPASWFYFQYADGRLGMFSSNETVNAELMAKSNALKAKPGDFIFYASDIAETLGFINRYRQTYLDIFDAYNMDDPVPGMDLPITTEDTGFPADTEEDDDDGF